MLLVVYRSFKTQIDAGSDWPGWEASRFASRPLAHGADVVSTILKPTPTTSMYN